MDEAQSAQPDTAQAEEYYRKFLKAVGLDTGRADLLDTPARVVRMYEELLTPVPFTPTSFVNDGQYDSLVMLKDVPFFSLCEHHVIPFFGVAHVGYLPGERVLGLSKLARFVEKRARALQVQERMTTQVADDIQNAIDPAGIGVIIDARHLCAEMRGVRKMNMVTRTSVMRGDLLRNASLKAEFMEALR